MDYALNTSEYMEDACTGSLASIPELEHKVDAAINEDTPPNTVLVRWKGELLLLDAWNVTGVSWKF